jgi:hypothetical protein
MGHKWLGSLLIFMTCLAAATLSPQVVAQGPGWVPVGPVPRFSHSAVLDPATERMIVFGGVLTPISNSSTSQNFNDVWRLNRNLKWTALQPTGTPPDPRNGHSAVYDPGSNSMIVFGGGLGFTSPCTSDVWVLTDANDVGRMSSWVKLNPAGSAPAPRLRHTAVYNPSSNTMVVYGGNDCGSTNFGDVWVLTNANGQDGTPTWVQLNPSGPSPGPREDLTAVYDPGSNSMIFFSGVNGPFNPNDVWVLSNADGSTGAPAWTQLAPSGTPPSARGSYSASYDATNNRMIIFGGANAAGLLRDVWVLSDANGIGSPAWTQLGPFTVFPETRAAHTAVYDPATNAMIVFGGITNVSGTAHTNNVWVLTDANGL